MSQKTMYSVPHLTSTELYRFHKRYIRGKIEDCWAWDGHLRHGYGEFKIHGLTYPASRIAWFVHKGYWAGEKLVLHTCDNPACVNPAHLWLGTNADNMRDKKLKGRARVNVGVDHPLAKLNDGYVLDIRYLYKTGRYSQTDLANMYGISRTGIEMALHYNWKHI